MEKTLSLKMKTVQSSKTKIYLNYFFALFFIILLIRFQSFLSEPLFSDDIFFIGFILLIALLLIRKSKSILSAEFDRAHIIGIIFLLYFIFFGLIIGIIVNPNNFADLISENLMQYIIWFLFIFLTLAFIKIYNCFNLFLQTTYYAISIFLLACYIFNFDGLMIFLPSNFISIFVADPLSRYRVAFGFSHANNCADFCLLGLIFSIFIKARGIKKNAFWLITDIVKFIMILSTSSRGNILGFAIFVAFLFYFNIENIIGGRAHYKYLKILFTIILIIFLGVAIMVASDLDFAELFSQTNREFNFTINVPKMLQMDGLWLGIGFIGSGVFGFDSSIGSFTYVDNYYLYVFLTTGIIGCVFIAAILLLIFFGIRKKKDKGIFHKCIISFVIMWLFLSFFESQMFNHAFLSSYFYTPLILYYVSSADNSL